MTAPTTSTNARTSSQTKETNAMTTTTYVDRELLAVLTALAPLGNDGRLTEHLNIGRREFDVQGALDVGTWSSGERALIEWAGALWKGRGTVDIGYIANMGGRFLNAALGALAAYRGERIPAFDSTGQIADPLRACGCPTTVETRALAEDAGSICLGCGRVSP